MKTRSCQKLNIMENDAEQSSWDVKQLLKEWKLESILPHLIAEKIDGEILQMIKIPHIRMLLGRFPLGIQIRFEYNLEQWRCNIGSPLKGHTCDEVSNFLAHKTSSITPKELCREGPKSVSTLENHCAPKQVTPIQISVGPLDRTAPKPPKDPLLVNKNMSVETTGTRCKFTTQFSKNNSLMPYTSKPHGPVPKVRLRDILMESEPEGPQLIQIYRTNKNFTRQERRRLVNTLVNYYLRNDLEFGLQTSYALERAILKMFPNERLDMYRKAKRGSIYCKYSSAKVIYKKLQQLDDNDPRRLKMNEEMFDMSDKDMTRFPDDATASINRRDAGSAAYYSGNDDSVPTVSNMAHENNDPLDANPLYGYNYMTENYAKDVKPSIVEDAAFV